MTLRGTIKQFGELPVETPRTHDYLFFCVFKDRGVLPSNASENTLSLFAQVRRGGLYGVAHLNSGPLYNFLDMTRPLTRGRREMTHYIGGALLNVVNSLRSAPSQQVRRCI